MLFRSAGDARIPDNFIWDKTLFFFMDWMDVAFVPQDLLGDIWGETLNVAGAITGDASGLVSAVQNTVSSLVGVASSDVQQVQQGVQQVQNTLAGVATGSIQQVQNTLVSAPTIIAATVSNETSAAKTSVVTLLTQATQGAQNLLSSPSVAVTKLETVISPALTAAENLITNAPAEASSGVSQIKSLLGSDTSSLKQSVTGTVSQVILPAISTLGAVVKTTEAAATTAAAGATNELLGVAKAGAAVETAVPVFQSIYNAGTETDNVIKNVLSGNPAFQGITTGTVITSPSGNSNNPVVTALQGVSTAANALPGVNFQLFETIAGPNANPVVLTGAQILDFTLQHPLETALVVAGAALTAGAGVPEETVAVEETVVAEETGVATPNVETTMTEDISSGSGEGDVTGCFA